MDTTRIPPAAGVAGTALVFAGLLTANAAIHASQASDAPATIASDFATNADGVRRGVWLALVGLALVFPFLADLRRRIRDAEGDDGILAPTAFAGGIVGVAGLIGYLALLVASSTDSIGAHPESAATLRLLGWEYGGVLAPAYAALVGAASIAMIRYRLLHPVVRPLAWLGLPLAAALAVSGFLGGALVVGSLLWLILFAAALALQPAPAGEGEKRLLRPTLAGWSRLPWPSSSFLRSGSESPRRRRPTTGPRLRARWRRRATPRRSIAARR